MLLILAGISIAMLTGDNGLLTKASTAKTETEHKTVVEALRIKFNEFQIHVSEGEATDFLEFLKNYESGAIVDENGVVNVENLKCRQKIKILPTFLLKIHKNKPTKGEKIEK